MVTERLETHKNMRRQGTFPITAIPTSVRRSSVCATGHPSLPRTLGLGASMRRQAPPASPSAALRPQRYCTPRSINAPTMALRRDASPASPVDARLPRATCPRFALLGTQRMISDVIHGGDTNYEIYLLLASTSLFRLHIGRGK